jgi:hypothetical protein
MIANPRRYLSMRPLFGCLPAVVCLGLLLTACGGNEPSASASPVAPTPVAPAPAAPVVPNVTLSGGVTENGHPVENASVNIQWSCGGGCSALIGGMTDAAGRYVVARPTNGIVLPDGATIWVTAYKDGFVQQCAATAVMRAGVSLDLQLTSIANLSMARPLSGAGSRTVSGTVFESTPAGRRPVADAAVSAYSEALYYADPVAFTRSDAAGRYLLCGLSQGRIPNLVAEKEGYNFSNASVEPGTDTTVDIQIRR